MRFGVLGPLEVRGAAGEVAVGGPKERAVLAALVVRANAVVTNAQLVDDLWGEDPPRSAAKTIQTYISHLRRALPEAALDTVGAGYRLVAADDAVDSRRFEALLDDAHDALVAGDPQRAMALLDEALALWRGEPLAEFEEMDFATAERTRLAELAADRDRGPGSRPRPMAVRIDAARCWRLHPAVPRMGALRQAGPLRDVDGVLTFHLEGFATTRDRRYAVMAYGDGRGSYQRI